jgi:hypothetical protein
LGGNITIVLNDETAQWLRDLIAYGKDDLHEDMGEKMYNDLTKLERFIDRFSKIEAPASTQTGERVPL